jgi:GH25 family lysozyme M1 (1,4-beta-N-acetylmuramidase)
MTDGKKDMVKLTDEIIPSNDQPKLMAKKNNYDLTNLYANGDLRYYYKGKKCVSKTGIDVSYYQGKIDWKKVKKVLDKRGRMWYNTSKL